MKFIHFGCWNKGKCSLRNINEPVSAVMQNIKHEIENPESMPYEFLVVAGDNYYPKKINKIKFFNEEDLKSGFECLEQIPIKKYIVFGNHEYGDIYFNTIKSSTISSEPRYCLNINRQFGFDGKQDFEIFKNVMHNYDDSSKTLVIMIDTTIYENDLEAEEIQCFNGLFGIGKLPNLTGKSTEMIKSVIDEIRERQYLQVSKVLSMYKDTQKIIFIGHHPIIQCRFKKSKNQFDSPTSLKDFFKSLYRTINGKIIYYLCADTHFYQKGNIRIVISPDMIINIEQHIVGTGGTSCDTICNSNNSYLNKENDLHYQVIEEQQEYGYLKYNDIDSFQFNAVPYKLAYHTVINGEHKFSDDVNHNEPSKLCQNGGGRKYKIIY